MVGHLLTAKWQQLRNTPRSGEGGRAKAFLFVAFGLAIWAGIYFGSDWFLAKCLEVEPIGELVVEKTLDLVLLLVFSMLLFSNVITSFSTFFLAEDLQLLMVRPIDPDVLYSARFIETMAVSGWMPVAFALPVFVNAGILYGASWGYYAMVVVALLAMGVIAAALAVPLTIALTNILPAHRTRDILIFFGVLAFVIVFILFRAINPEEMFRPEQFNSTVEVFASLGTPSSIYSPSSWALEALRPLLRGESEIAVMHLGALLTSAAGLYFIGAWSFRRWHASGFSKAMEGRHAGAGLERAGGWLARKRVAGPEAARRAIAAIEAGAGRLRPTLEMMRKDGKVFIRDTAQWSQLVLLVALVVIYLLNFRYFRTLGQGGIIGPFGLYVMNIGLCGFIVAAVGLRFLFPAISLEGRSFWLIRTSPQTMRQFVLSKGVVGAIPMFVISQLLTSASNLMIGTPWPMTVAAIFVIGALVVGLAGLGVGLGALYPRFDSDNAAKIATSFGGMAYMLCALVLVAVVVALMMPPTWMLLHLLADGAAPYTRGGRVWIPILCGVGVFALPLLVGAGAMRLGARRLARI